MLVTDNMDARDYFRRMILEDCEVATLTGEITPELMDGLEFRAVIKEFEREGTIYMYDSRNGSGHGLCKMIAGFTEKGKLIYMPHGKLLDAYRLKKLDLATEQDIAKDKCQSGKSEKCPDEDVLANMDTRCAACVKPL